MPSTIQLQRTINLAQQYLYNRPLTFTSPTNNDPALSNADWVMQTILSPALGGWRWNRAGASPSLPTFATQVGVSDYKVNLPKFGWIEKAAAYDPNSGYLAMELKVAKLKATETLPNQTTEIAAQFDDDTGNITFRIFPAPDRVYNIVVDYQQSAPIFTTLTQLWTPIPDYLSYLYNEGFQAKGYEYCADTRFQGAMQLFLTDLSAEAEGLNQTQKNLWLDSKLNSLRQTQAVQQGRG